MSVKNNSGAEQGVLPQRLETYTDSRVSESNQTIVSQSPKNNPIIELGFGAKTDWNTTIRSLLGSVIRGKYELLELLGTGGMGAVFKASNKTTRSPVAIKILHPSLANDSVSLKRFQLEAKAAFRINHVNSVSVIDYGVWEGRAFLVMDYLPGAPLAQIIKRQGKLSPEMAVPIFVQACNGLSAAHKIGIFHRDVKPSNFIVLSKQDSLMVKVCDFGLVKLKVPEGETLTGTGEVFGSPPYMSPEQCMGQAIDERSDIYSMGILMFETLMGYLPIKGKTPLDTMRKQVSAAPPPLQVSFVHPKISEKMRAIVNKALSKDREDRFRNMDELKAALEELEGEMSSRA